MSDNYEELSLYDILQILKKNAKFIITLFMIFVLITGTVTYFIIPKKYQSKIVFHLEEEGGRNPLSSLASLGALAGNFGLPVSLGSGGTKADLCSEIVLARQFLYKVLTKNNLPAGPEDIESFRDMVEVEIKESGALEISALWTDPKTAYDLTQTIFDQYNEIVDQYAQKSSSKERVFLETQYEKTKERLLKAEQELLKYQKEKGLIILPEQANKAIEYFAELEKQILETEIGLDAANSSLAEAEKLMAKEAPLLKATVTESLNPYLSEYKSRLANLEMEIAQARGLYTGEHPTVKTLVNQQAELKKKIEEESDIILSSETFAANPIYQQIAGEYLTGQIEAVGLEAKLLSLKRIHERYNQQLEKLPEDIIEYGRLVREQKVAEQIYMLLVSQLEQAKIAEAKEDNINIQVIDPPVIPHKKHSPSTVLNTAIAGVLAIFIGVFVAFAREYFQNYVDQNKEIEYQ